MPWLLLGIGLLTLSFLGDAMVEGWVDSSHSKFLKHAARLISYLGDWPALVIGALAVGALGMWLRRRCWRIVALMILAASLAGGAANVGRCLTGRARPHSDMAPGWYGPAGKHLRLARHSINSFPSAHTTTAMAYFVTLLILAPKVGVWFMPAPLLVGASRLYLGVHHLSDVCAGLLLGLAVAVLTCRVLGPRWTAIKLWWTTRSVGRLLASRTAGRAPFAG